MRKEKVGFFEHSTLVLQVSGQFSIETANQKISMKGGEMMLIRKNQLGELIKMPVDGGDYQTIIICLKEDMLRQLALEEQIEPGRKYTGQPISGSPKMNFCGAFFNR